MVQFPGVLGKSRHVLIRSRSERLMQSFYSKLFQGNLNPPSSTLGRFCNLSRSPLLLDFGMHLVAYSVQHCLLVVRIAKVHRAD